MWKPTKKIYTYKCHNLSTYCKVRFRCVYLKLYQILAKSVAEIDSDEGKK